MTQTVTFDDVWRMFQETDLKFQETDRRMKETDLLIKENAIQIKETGIQMKETDRKFQETDLLIKENAIQMKETDRQVEKVSKLVGNLGSRWGEFVEGLVAPSCIAMFTERGIPVDEVYLRAKKTVAGERMEIDILVANSIAAVLVEVKSRLQVEDVRTHLNRLEKFKTFFTRYATYQIYGAVAGIVIDAEADKFAMNRGLFVIVQSGETVKLANRQEFNPRIW